MYTLSRRAFCAGLAAALTLANLPAQAQLFGSRPSNFPQSFSSFAVDVGPLKAKGLGGFADLVGSATLNQLRRSFADRVDPRGPRLVVRIDQIFLTPFPDGGGDNWWGNGGGAGGTDSINGVALAIGRRGEVIAQHPQLAVLDIRRSIVDPDEQGRAVAIAQHYVLWLRRQLID